MDPQELDHWRYSNIGRLLNRSVTRFEGRIFDILAERGRDEIPAAYLPLTRNLDRSGTRITDLARRARMTKQGMSLIVAQCEQAGLVQRYPDPDDARAKIVRFTDHGLDWLDAFRDALAGAEAEMRAELGEPGMSALSAALAVYGGTGSD